MLTFEPHPADFFAGGRKIFRLTSRDAKAHRLRELGLDGMFVLTFDAALAGLDAEAFLARFWCAGLARRGGGRLRFPFRRQTLGHAGLFARGRCRTGLDVEIVEKVAADEEGSLDAVSSTATREALNAATSPPRRPCSAIPGP